jgi:hypothetical protein
VHSKGTIVANVYSPITGYKPWYFYAKRVLARELVLVPVDGKVDIGIPREIHCTIVISVVGVALPVSR